MCLARCEEAKEHERKRERLASHVVGNVAFSGNVELLLQDAGECLHLAVMRCGRYRHVYVAVSQEGFRVLRHHFTTGASPLSASISGLLAGDPGCADRDVSDGCRRRGGQADHRLLAKVGRSFAFGLEHDLYDCSEG